MRKSACVADSNARRQAPGRGQMKLCVAYTIVLTNISGPGY